MKYIGNCRLEDNHRSRIQRAIMSIIIWRWLTMAFLIALAY